MDEYFVATEGGELSFMESSDGNILVDQGQNIPQSEAANLIYAPTQLYYVQGPQQQQQQMIGGETQTLYRAPVQEIPQQYIIIPSDISHSSQPVQCVINPNSNAKENKDDNLELPGQPIENAVMVQHGQDVGGKQSEVISIQQNCQSPNKLVQIQRNAFVGQNAGTSGIQLLANDQQEVQIMQPQLCITASGQIIDNSIKNVQAPRQRIIRQVAPANLQQIIGQSGKFMLTNKNLQSIAQLKVQQQLANVEGSKLISHLKQPVDIQVQHSGMKGKQTQKVQIQQRSVSQIRQLSSSFQLPQLSSNVQVQQNDQVQLKPGFHIQQNPIGNQGQQNVIMQLQQNSGNKPEQSSVMQVQQNSGNRMQQNSMLKAQSNSILQVQQSSGVNIKQRSVSQVHLNYGVKMQNNPVVQVKPNCSTTQPQTVKLEYSIPRNQMRCQANLNVTNNQIVAQVRPVIANDMKQSTKSSSFSINNMGSETSQSYILNTQSSPLSNTTGGYVVQSNKRSLGQAMTLSGGNMLLQCRGCQHVLLKPGKCSKCGGTISTKIFTTSSAPCYLQKVEGGIPSHSNVKSISSQSQTLLQQQELGNAESLDKKILAIKSRKSGRGRGRGRGRNRVPEEPVILTLSSDDESGNEKEMKGKQSPIVYSCAQQVLHAKEPIIKNEETSPLQCMLLSEVTQPFNEGAESTYASLQCRNIRIGSYSTTPKKKVTFSASAIYITVPPVSSAPRARPVSILLPTDKIFKILVHFGSSIPVFFLYVKPQLAACIRLILGLKDPSTEYFDPCSKEECQKRITIISEKMNEEAKKLMKFLYKTPIRVTNSGMTVPMLEEISQREANKILTLSSVEKSKSIVMKNSSLQTKSLLVFPPKHKGAVTITIDDYNCLEEEQFLNDVIVDFYLKWLVTSKPDNLRSRTHVFSTFFYKRLTAMPAKGRKMAAGSESDLTLTPAQRRHARVKSWTKGVDIFNKDYIIIPINEHSHWFLAIICFPGASGTKLQSDDQMHRKRAKASVKCEVPLPDGEWSDRDEASGDDEELLDFEEEEVQKPTKQNTSKMILKQPCILLFDSLRGTNRTRILATLRDYLTIEYRQRRGLAKIFSKDTMKGCIPMVPQQTNLSDCGLFTLHFAECFFEKPLQDYFLPIKYLADWFPQEDVDKKREQIANLIKSLMDECSPNHGITLPNLTFQHNESEKSHDENTDTVKTSIEASASAIKIGNLVESDVCKQVHINISDGQLPHTLSENLVTSSTFPPIYSTAKKMQQSIIRDSETSEVLLIVNPPSEPQLSAANDDRTTKSMDIDEYNFVESRSTLIDPQMSKFYKSSKLESGSELNNTIPATQSLLELAEIAAIQERSVATTAPATTNPDNYTPISAITSFQRYSSLPTYSARTAPTIPSMTSALNKVVSSGGSVTVSSPAITGLLSSSKISERRYIPSGPNVGVSNFESASGPAYNSSPFKSSPEISTKLNMSNVSKVQSKYTEENQIGPTRLITERDTDKNDRSPYTLSINSFGKPLFPSKVCTRQITQSVSYNQINNNRNFLNPDKPPAMRSTLTNSVTDKHSVSTSNSQYFPPKHLVSNVNQFPQVRTSNQISKSSNVLNIRKAPALRNTLNKSVVKKSTVSTVNTNYCQSKPNLNKIPRVTSFNQIPRSEYDRNPETAPAVFPNILEKCTPEIPTVTTMNSGPFQSNPIVSNIKSIPQVMSFNEVSGNVVNTDNAPEVRNSMAEEETKNVSTAYSNPYQSNRLPLNVNTIPQDISVNQISTSPNPEILPIVQNSPSKCVSENQKMATVYSNYMSTVSETDPIPPVMHGNQISKFSNTLNLDNAPEVPNTLAQFVSEAPIGSSINSDTWQQNPIVSNVNPVPQEIGYVNDNTLNITVQPPVKISCNLEEICTPQYKNVHNIQNMPTHNIEESTQENDSKINSDEASTEFRVSARSSSGRKIATPKRFRDYATDIPNTVLKKRVKGRHH